MRSSSSCPFHLLISFPRLASLQLLSGTFYTVFLLHSQSRMNSGQRESTLKINESWGHSFLPSAFASPPRKKETVTNHTPRHTKSPLSLSLDFRPTTQTLHNIRTPLFARSQVFYGEMARQLRKGDPKRKGIHTHFCR